MKQHPIPFNTGEEEKLWGPLSISATIWIASGGFLSYHLGKALPPLALPYGLSYIPPALPFFICAICAFVRYKDMTLIQFFKSWIRFVYGNRRLLFERRDIPLGITRKKIEDSNEESNS